MMWGDAHELGEIGCPAMCTMWGDAHELVEMRCPTMCTMWGDAHQLVMTRISGRDNKDENTSTLKGMKPTGRVKKDKDNDKCHFYDKLGH
ncbi:Uncharacterized protein TCM_023679 [Theobroma cacao]|uniref:Uncharacterized protein n=1 Tax=Theobroma cacao TaxID=3641 RepID=A0A061EWC5_THECC|nr:Uncharacterized protein TCM_023679 [Theobroma cacao]